MPKSFYLRTARRMGAEAQVDLAFVRRWFADDPNAAGGSGQQNANGGSGESGQVNLDELPEPVRKYIKELRDEAASNRVEAKRLRQEQEAAASAARARLAEEGNFKTLAEQHAAEAAKLKPYQERAEALEGIIRESNKARIERIPEDMRSIIPMEYPPEKLAAWLDASVEKLLKRPAPDLDAGAGGSGRTATLTDAEKQMAVKSGMTVEQWIAAKQKAGL